MKRNSTHTTTASPCRSCRYYYANVNGRMRMQTATGEIDGAKCHHPYAAAMAKQYAADFSRRYGATDIEAANLALCAEYVCVTMATANSFCEMWTDDTHKSILPPPPLTAPMPPQAPTIADNCKNG